MRRVRGGACIALGLLTFAAASGGGVHRAHAAPFTCSGDIYQVQSGQLRVFDPLSSTYVNVGTNQGSYNAAGFNTLDNFGYASQGNNVVRIHSNGNLDTLYNVGFNSYAGDVDNNNRLWLRRSASQYSAVNLLNGTVTTTNFTGQTVNAADVAFVQNGATGFLIAVSGTQVGVLNLNNGTSTRKTLTGTSGGGGYGATWTDSTGRVFTFRNATGEIFELGNVFGGGNATATLVAQGDPSGNNDGFSCNQAPFPNLPPLALDDDFTTPMDTPVNDNVYADHGNGVDNDPEGQALTTNTTPVTPPSNGTVVLSTNGDFVYTPDDSFVGTDTFVYEISDPSGLTAQATVTITITGPDPVIAVVKTSTVDLGGDGILNAGDTITYSYSVTNPGPRILEDIGLSESAGDFTGAGGVPVPSYVSGGSDLDGDADAVDLGIGDPAILYSATYTILQADINAQGVTNQAVAIGTAPGGQVATDTSDESGTGAGDNDPTVTALTASPSLSITKVADNDSLRAAGDTITYTYTVTNTGNVPVNGVTVSDAHNGSGSAPVAGTETLLTDVAPLGDSTDAANNSSWDVIGPGDTITFVGSYVVTQVDVDTLQ